MKPWHSFLTHDWRAKGLSLALATLLWLFIQHSISYSPALPPPPPPPRVQSIAPPARE